MLASRLVIFVLTLLLPIRSFAETNDDVESRVRAYFSDAPIMVAIAKCESEFRQFGKGETALHGGYGGSMIGVFQIHETVHAEYAKNNGMDIYSLEGNLAYARHLFDREGTKPWLSSFSCWNKETVNAESASSTPPKSSELSLNLSMGMEHESVSALQKILNAAGFVIAESGPGSSGNETIKFGALTRAAVRKFQCQKMSVCDGDEYTNGYGYVGNRTRTALVAASTEVGSLYVAENAPAKSEDDHAAEIARLQAQIAELTKVLSELMKARDGKLSAT